MKGKKSTTKERTVTRDYYCLVCTPAPVNNAVPLTNSIQDLLDHFDQVHHELNVRQLVTEKKLIGRQGDAMFLDGEGGTYLNIKTDYFDLPEGVPLIRRSTSDGNM